MPLDPPPAGDIDLHVEISRVDLGMDPLEMGLGTDYGIAPGSWGAQVQWDRQQATSPYVDGAATTRRRRQMVNEPLVVEVYGVTYAGCVGLTNALLDALKQSTFVVQWTINSVTTAYACEAADYQVAYEAPRLAAAQGKVTASIPTQPQPLVGGF